MSEVVEVQKESLDALNQTRQLFDTLLNDGEFGMALKRKVKEKIPAARFNDLEIVDTVTKPYDEKISRLSEENKKLEERLNRWEEKELNAAEEGELNKELDRVRKTYNFTDDGMKKVISRMTEKKNPDAESAAAWVLSQEPKTAPVTPSSLFGGKSNLFGSASETDEWRDLNNDPQGYADKEIANILSHPEQYREYGGNL